jgi:hypothetical protein
MTASTLLPVFGKIDRANLLIAERRRAVERQFQTRRLDHFARTGDSMSWIRNLSEIAPAADDAVPTDGWPEAFAALTDVADAFLVSSDAERAELSTRFAAASALADGHVGYFARASAELGATRDAVWLRRSLALAALAAGGSDYRDEHLALDGLGAAARACGVDPAPEFRRVAALASASTPFGHGPTSVRDSLMRLARR